MKQKLKISIGSSLQKAATCLTVAATIAALSISFSCSSDNDYEEPWLNKEHKTRAMIMTYENENIDITGKRILAGNTMFTIGTEPKCEIEVSWTAGYVGGWKKPESSISITSVNVAYPSQGHAAIRQYTLQWNAGTRHIEGSIEVEGNYIPEHIDYNIEFRYTSPVSAQATPVIYGD